MKSSILFSSVPSTPCPYHVPKSYVIIKYGIAMVWIINGLLCKMLNLVPRHEHIIASILGEDHARLFAVIIGIAEVMMAFWILSNLWSHVCAITQIVIVLSMNVMELMIAPDLLLWGSMNILFAGIFVGVVWYSEFVLINKLLKDKCYEH